MWLVASAFAAPAEVRWIADLSVGATVDRVSEVLKKDGATQVAVMDFRDPGAFARGLLDPPGLLAQLHRVGVSPPWFEGLPASGPRFVVADGDGGRASYVFVQGKLAAMALELNERAIAPTPDPFRRDRLAPMLSAVAGLCGSLRPTERDDYGNVVAWRGESCSGGTLIARYVPVEPEAALQVVVFGR